MLTSTDRHPFKFEALSKAHRKLLPDTFGQAPNVSGNPDIGTWSNKETEPYGAFYQGVIQANTAIPWENDTKNDLVYINFDASKSNAIYGASQRVQSRSVQLLMIIKS